jgi:DNA-binding GntR family transcriptional regulator
VKESAGVDRVLSNRGKDGGRDAASDERIDIEAAICARIRAAVSAGELPPGTKLPEEAVAESIAASRGQVRAAFQRLAFEGLVDLQRNRGAFIAHPTVKEAKDVFEARRVIERVTTEIVTRTILTHHLGALSRDVEANTALWLRSNRQAAIGGISAFHLYLAALAHNAALTTALERLIIRTSLILGVYATARTFATLPAEYEMLVELIAAGRSLDAARQMERCLFVIEGELEFYHPDRREVDVRRLMRMVG